VDPALPLGTAVRRRPLVRRLAHVLSYLLIAAGLLGLAWALLVWRWQDPITALYTHFQQERLASSYEHRVRAYTPPKAVPHVRRPDPAAAARVMAVDAAAWRRSLHTGGAVGRLKIGRIGLSMIVVQGTDHDSLKRGPGHYVGSGLPGAGHLIYIAGHRTTYLAPFSAIDRIRAGDYVTFSVPYGTFSYRVFRHYVVPATDLGALRDHGQEILRLQACHPRFFATHRYLVDARLVAFQPRGTTTWLRAPAAS